MTKSESRTKPKPTAAASEPQIKDVHATSSATARESRSEGRPETRASLEDRDFSGTTRGSVKSDTRGREGERVRKTESLSANLSDSPRRRVSRLVAEHRKVATREAKEREMKREQSEKLEDSSASTSTEEGRKELRAESLRRRREEEVEVRRGRTQNEGKREDSTQGKKDDIAKEMKVEDRKTETRGLGSPSSREDTKRVKQEESSKREDLRRGKQQDSKSEVREETGKAGGKDEDKKGATEKRAQKEDQEKEDVSDSEDKEGNKQKKRVSIIFTSLINFLPVQLFLQL